jgi:signal transduction histidine kinase
VVVDLDATPIAPERTPKAATERAAEMRTLVVGFLVLVFVAVATWQGSPRPGVHGAALEVAVALGAVGIGVAGIVLLSRARPLVQIPFMLSAVAGSAVLVATQHRGIALLGVMPAVSAAALRLPLRLSVVVAFGAVVAFALAGAAAAWAVTGTLLDEFAIVAFFAMALFTRRLGESNERTRRLLEEVQRSRDAQTRAAAMAERQRLAREMHDVLAHSLSGLVLNLESANLLAERAHVDPELAATINRARGLARSGLAEARGAIGMLRDDALPGPDRLAELALAFESDSGVACALSVTGHAHELGGDARLTLYRVAQEALSNVRKHARAARVEVRLDYEPSGTRLIVEDVEAPGRPPVQGDGSGYGLTGMRERAELIGATFEAGPTVDGFRVELWVPA